MATVTPSFYVQFLTLSIPVKLYTAARRDTISMPVLHKPCVDKGLVATRAQSYVCRGCNQPTPKEECVKGYEISKGQYVLISDEEIDSLDAEKSRLMEVRTTVPVSQVDTIYFSQTDWIGPAEPTVVKPFLLLRASLQATERAALVTYVQRGTDKIGLLVPDRDEPAFRLHDLFYPSEIDAFSTKSKVKISLDSVSLSDRERELGVVLVESVAGDFDLSPYGQTYADRLRALVAKKQAGETISLTAAPALVATASDDMLMKALEAAASKVSKKPPTKIEEAKPVPATVQRRRKSA